MKKIILTTTALVVTNLVSAQVAIGKEAVNGNSALLDFYDQTDNFRGIILPTVDNINNALATTTTQNNGTFLFDKSDAKLKMYENGAWVELSDTGNKTQIVNNTTIENSQNQGAIIGKNTSNAKGVLVLESADKAMILPKIANPHITVKSPYPGMMCYDTVGKALAVFDGNVWNYWK
ncbi:hypothetical protein [Soonwooa purpurea]